MLAFPTLSQIYSLLYANTWRVTPWWSRDERVSVERSLLRLLRIAYQEQIEVAPLVDAFALEHRRLPRYRLKRLAKRLRSGTPLIDALEQTPNIVSDDNLIQLRFASQSGTLQEAWDRVVHDDSQVATDIRFQLKQTLIYQAVVMFLILNLIVMMNAFIVPTFVKLWRELEMPISSGIQLSSRFASAISQYSGSLFAATVIVLFGSWFLSPIRFFRRNLAAKWFSPVASLRTANVLRMVSQSTLAGRPLSGSLSTLAKYHYDTTLRGKLLVARNEVEQGVEPWDSLSRSGILTANETKALRESSTPRIQSWLMLKLAETKEERVLQKAEVLVSLIHPVMTLVFGLIVLWIGMICFSGLSHLISSLS